MHNDLLVELLSYTKDAEFWPDIYKDDSSDKRIASGLQHTCHVITDLLADYEM